MKERKKERQKKERKRVRKKERKKRGRTKERKKEREREGEKEREEQIQKDWDLIVVIIALMQWEYRPFLGITRKGLKRIRDGIKGQMREDRRKEQIRQREESEE